MEWYKRIWVEHPHSVNETYLQHLYFAMKMGTLLMILGVIALIHSIFPFMFKETVSNYLYKMTDEMKNRNRQILDDNEWF